LSSWSKSQIRADFSGRPRRFSWSGYTPWISKCVHAYIYAMSIELSIRSTAKTNRAQVDFDRPFHHSKVVSASAAIEPLASRRWDVRERSNASALAAIPHVAS
jgi:hypothetical protein